MTKREIAWLLGMLALLAFALAVLKWAGVEVW